MKVKTLQIVWHEQKPVFSLDFHSSGWLVTAGADSDIKVGKDEDGYGTSKYLSSFSRHSSTVNIVRFAPTGDVLASGGDNGEVFLWKRCDNAHRGNLLSDDGGGAGPAWRVCSSLLGHSAQGDVQDLVWAPDGSGLLSGSVENVCLVWDLEGRNGQPQGRLADHGHFVQGVAWDPRGQAVVSQSLDRTCKVYVHGKPPTTKKGAAATAVGCGANANQLKLHATLYKRSVAARADTAEASAGACGAAKPKMAKHCMFHDENLNAFCRRLAWSPDGAFLAVPAGEFKVDADSPPINALYLFARNNWSAPAVQLPSLSKPVVCVRFCPVIFKLREQLPNETPAPFCLPYRMVFAVATMNSVLIYDTQSLEPLMLLGGLHLAAITDLAWSQDVSTLAVSSYDGYCSLATFEPGELGIPEQLQNLPASVVACVSKKAAMNFAQHQVAQAAAAAAKAHEKAAAAAAAATTTTPTKAAAADPPPGVVAASPAAAALEPTATATSQPSTHMAAHQAAGVITLCSSAVPAPVVQQQQQQQIGVSGSSNPATGGMPTTLQPPAVAAAAAATAVAVVVAAAAGASAPSAAPALAARRRVTPMPINTSAAPAPGIIGAASIIPQLRSPYAMLPAAANSLHGAVTPAQAPALAAVAAAPASAPQGLPAAPPPAQPPAASSTSSIPTKPRRIQPQQVLHPSTPALQALATPSAKAQPTQNPAATPADAAAVAGAADAVPSIAPVSSTAAGKGLETQSLPGMPHDQMAGPPPPGSNAQVEAASACKGQPCATAEHAVHQPALVTNHTHKQQQQKPAVPALVPGGMSLAMLAAQAGARTAQAAAAQQLGGLKRCASNGGDEQAKKHKV